MPSLLVFLMLFGKTWSKNIFLVNIERCMHRSFVGYNNMNYALSEVRDPVRTIKRAAPIAMTCVTLAYFLINLAYFAVVSKNDIIGSRRIIA
jgi:amino acid transporter